MQVQVQVFDTLALVHDVDAGGIPVLALHSCHPKRSAIRPRVEAEIKDCRLFAVIPLKEDAGASRTNTSRRKYAICVVSVERAELCLSQSASSYRYFLQFFGHDGYGLSKLRNGAVTVIDEREIACNSDYIIKSKNSGALPRVVVSGGFDVSECAEYRSCWTPSAGRSLVIPL
jgi:hypothetical protein